MALNQFNFLAGSYDWLAKIVFGKNIQASQKHFLYKISTCSTVLILGGGTGRILVELRKVNPVCEVYYIDASSSMIARAKRKNQNSNIHFIHGTENDIPTSVTFDGVITNFYLDLFHENYLEQVIKKITKSLQPTAIWIATDFIDGKKWWQQLLLNMMYRFFRSLCKIQAKKIPEWNASLQHMGMKKIDSKFFYSHFIESAVYILRRF